MQSLDGIWQIVTDAENVGRDKRWSEERPDAEARDATVPGTVQMSFPNYYGVSWWYREFTPDPELYTRARQLLTFGAVDYVADVWLNGTHVGTHEGGETSFVLDVTDALQQNAENLLAVRVINPAHEPVDGYALNEIPHKNRSVPYRTGACYNHGGIWMSVELAPAHAVRTSDIFVRPDVETGTVRIQATVHNDLASASQEVVRASIAPATGGSVIDRASETVTAAPGETTHAIELTVPTPQLWSVDDPYLYRVTVSLDSGDEQSVRCGFRDLRFSDGHFRLNGKRIYLRSAHHIMHYPVGMEMSPDPEMYRRDIYFAKAMGFNMVRFIATVAHPCQLDLCDELGLMVYTEARAGWCLADSPHMAERYDLSYEQLVRRDRNHASVVMWGMLNETGEGPVFRQAVKALALMRSLDDTRVVHLGSGRWDGDWSIGTLSNPGSTEWEHLLGGEEPNAPKGERADMGYMQRAGDAHSYPPIPLTPSSIRHLRTMGEGLKPVLLSEHGNGSSVDAVRHVRQYEQLGLRDDLEDYQLFMSHVENYLADWQRYGMDDVFADPRDLLVESHRVEAELRAVGMTAIRSNPNLCGYSLTGLEDKVMTGEGMWTMFRDLKPGMMDAMRESWDPLRWCLFVEPVHGYRGGTYRLEAVLTNEDALLPGEYPVRVRIVGPAGPVCDRRLRITVPDPATEPPLAMPVLSEDVKIDGPAGRYQVIATFERGGAPVCNRLEFIVSDAASFPAVDTEATVMDTGDRLQQWLGARGIPVRPFAEAAPDGREVLLVGTPGDEPHVWQQLAQRIARGGTAVFVSPAAFKRGDDETGWIPLVQKGQYTKTQAWAGGRDDYSKKHPIFDGMPTNGFMDMQYYRELIPAKTFDGQSTPDEVVAGSFSVSCYVPGGYNAGLHVAVYRLGAGRFILNALNILENLDVHPAADRLLLNMLTYAGRHVHEPPTEVDDSLLDTLGYR